MYQPRQRRRVLRPQPQLIRRAIEPTVDSPTDEFELVGIGRGVQPLVAQKKAADRQAYCGGSKSSD